MKVAKGSLSEGLATSMLLGSPYYYYLPACALPPTHLAGGGQLCKDVEVCGFVWARVDSCELLEAHLVVFYDVERLWEAHLCVFYDVERLCEAQLYVFYEVLRLWEAQL